MSYTATFRLVGGDGNDRAILALYKDLETENILVEQCPDVFIPKVGDAIIVHNPKATNDQNRQYEVEVSLEVRSVTWEIVHKTAMRDHAVVEPVMMLVVLLGPPRKRR